MPRRLKPFLDFHNRTHVMGVLNVTPDSFSDGGKFLDRNKAAGHAVQMAADGADMIDVGGESTRPGAREVSLKEELGRVIPVIKDISGKIDIPISIDTRKSRVAEKAIKAGASIVNDISALRHDPDMAKVLAGYDVWVILMHMKGMPQDMQNHPTYENLIKEMIDYFHDALGMAAASGIDIEKVIIDPGIGFGKTVEHNLEILNRLNEFKILSRPICVGTSRKSFIGKVLDRPDPDARLYGTIAANVIAIMRGANVLRVHDVREAVEACRMTDSVLRQGAN